MLWRNKVKMCLDRQSVAGYKVLRAQGACNIRSDGRLKDFRAVHIQMVP